MNDGAEVGWNEFYNIGVPYNAMDRQVGVTNPPLTHENVIWGGGSNQRIHHNLFHDIDDAVITFPHPCWDKVSGTAVIDDNIYYSPLGYAAVSPDSSDCNTTTALGRVYVVNNTFYSTGNSTLVSIAIRPGTEWTDAVIENNHFVDVPGYSQPIGGCAAGSVANGCTIANNLTETPAQAAAEGYAVGSLFAPASSTSPTVNAGIDASALLPGGVADFAGVARPQGSAWDIGAYEWKP